MEVEENATFVYHVTGVRLTLLIIYDIGFVSFMMIPVVVKISSGSCFHNPLMNPILLHAYDLSLVTIDSLVHIYEQVSTKFSCVSS